MGYGSEELYRYAGRGGNAYTQRPEDDRYLEMLSRGNDRTIEQIREAGKEQAEHEREMWRNYADIPKGIAHGYMTGRKFGADMEEAERAKQRFAEEQASIPLKRQAMEEQIKGASAQRMASEEQLASSKAEREFMTPERRQAEYDKKMEVLAAQLAGQKAGTAATQQQLANDASTRRVQAAAFDLQKALAGNMAANINNPNFANATAQDVGAKHKLTPQELSMAQAQASQAIADNRTKAKAAKQSDEMFKLTTDQPWQQHQKLTQDLSGRISNLTTMANNFKSYAAGQASSFDPTNVTATKEANDARVEFADMLESMGKVQQAADIRDYASRSFVDTRMKNAMIGMIKDLENEIRIEKTKLGQYSNTPDIRAQEEALQKLKKDVIGLETGFWASRPADNALPGAMIPAAQPPLPAGKRFTGGGGQPPAGAIPQQGPMQQAPYQPRPSMRQNQIPKAVNAQNVKPGMGGT